MAPEQDKLRRLALVARRYYLEDRNQSDIARELGVSRPLISRMLGEARSLGVVEILVHEPGEASAGLLACLQNTSALSGGALVPDGGDDKSTNAALSQAALDLLSRLGAKRLGIGWGDAVGHLVSRAEAVPPPPGAVAHVCPLVGDAGVPIRYYHSNENVRRLAERLGAEPYFLPLPALAESLEEKELLCSTSLYGQIERQWRQLDTVLVNIGNYPSTPDFASVARYGPLLQQQRACGRLLAYYFNEQGEIIRSDGDFAIQIPLELLARRPAVVGVCPANTGPRALRGALRTGLLTHLVAREALVRDCLAETGSNICNTDAAGQHFP